jgi:hypothetical protein
MVPADRCRRAAGVPRLRLDAVAASLRGPGSGRVELPGDDGHRPLCG